MVYSFCIISGVNEWYSIIVLLQITFMRLRIIIMSN